MAKLRTGLWASRADFEKEASKGAFHLRREAVRRLLDRDPPAPHINPLMYERATMKSIDNAAWDSWQRLRQPSYFMFDKILRDDVRANWRGVDPELMIFAGRMMAYFGSLEVPTFVHGAFRTRGEQDDAVSRGVSKAIWPRAAHCQGMAIDLVHGRYAWDLTQREWAAIGKVGKGIWEKQMLEIKPEHRRTLVWGGDWGFYDPAHWEIDGWKTDQKRPDVLEQMGAMPPVVYTRVNLYNMGKERGKYTYDERLDQQEQGKERYLNKYGRDLLNKDS